MEQLGYHRTDFHELWYLKIFRKSVEKIQVTLKSDKNEDQFTFLSYIAHFFLEWEIFETKVAEKIKTHVLCSIFLFRKSCLLWNNVEKYCRAGQTTDGNMAHANCILDTYDYKHTLRICSTYWFSAATKGFTNAPHCYVIRTLPVVFTESITPVSWKRRVCLFKRIFIIAQGGAHW